MTIDLIELKQAIYFLNVKELKDICDKLQLPRNGKKGEMINRILTYIETGKIIKIIPMPELSKAKKNIIYNLDKDSLILHGSYKNDLKTRNFMKSLIGDHFHFTVFGHDYIKERWLAGNPPTYQEFAKFWKEEYIARKNKRNTLKQEWAYLNFIQQYPNASQRDVIERWEKERAINVAKVRKMLSKVNDNIQLVPYDATWSEKAHNEIIRLKQILNFPFIDDIIHFGSTAIAGIKAKPIIDILIGVTELKAAKECIPILEAEGYGYWEENPKKDRMFFVKGRPPLGEKRTHHVHIFEVNSYEYLARPLFAKYLNEHQAEAIRYQHLKEELAIKYKEDREEYTRWKTNFVKEIVAKAITPYINFVSMQSEHLSLLKSWLIKPFINDGGDTEIIWTDELVKEKFTKYINNNNLLTKAAIVYIKELPIGYIIYDAQNHEYRKKNLDLFIGKEDFIDKELSVVITKKFQENYL